MARRGIVLYFVAVSRDEDYKINLSPESISQYLQKELEKQALRRIICDISGRNGIPRTSGGYPFGGPGPEMFFSSLAQENRFFFYADVLDPKAWTCMTRGAPGVSEKLYRRKLRIDFLFPR